MPQKGFPNISSLPALHVSTPEARTSSEHVTRSIGAENLPKLPAISSPYAKRQASQDSVAPTPQPGRWTPISISSGSSDEDDEKLVKVDQSVEGKQAYQRAIKVSYQLGGK